MTEGEDEEEEEEEEGEEDLHRSAWGVSVKMDARVKGG